MHGSKSTILGLKLVVKAIHQSLAASWALLPANPTKAVFILICVTFLLYGARVIEGGFVGDDCSHLAYAATHSLLEAFTNREAMLDQSYAHVTPILSAAFMLAISLFGLNDHGHYLLSVFTISLVCLASWFFLRHFVSARASLIGTLLWLTTAEVNHVVSSLSMIQYAWGLFFTALTLISINNFSRQKAHWAALATLAYALACLSKELYVPLVFIAWFWPRFARHERLLIALPLTCIAVSYTALRFWLFDGIGGYASFYDDSGHLAKHFVTALGSFWKLIAGQEPALWVAKLAVGLVVVHGLFSGRRPSLLFVLVCAFCLLAPIAQVLALGNLTSERLSFLVAWCVAIYAAWTAHHHPFRISLLLVAVCLQLIARFPAKPVDDFLGRHKTENRYLVDAPSGAAPLFAPRSPWIVYFNSTRLARVVIAGDQAPEILSSVDDLETLSSSEAERVVSWNSQCNCVQMLGPSVWNLVEEERLRLVCGAGFSWSGEVRMDKLSERVYRIAWKVDSPPARVSIELKNLGHFEVPKSGSRSFGRDTTFDLAPTIQVRARADLESGEVLQSAWMEMTTRVSSSVTWGRPNS